MTKATHTSDPKLLTILAGALLVLALAPSAASAQQANSYKVAIKAESGLYLRGDTSHSLAFDSAEVGPAETFTVIHTAEDKLKFRAPGGRWLVAPGDGSPAEPMVAAPHTHSDAESFHTLDGRVPISTWRALIADAPGRAWYDHGQLKTRVTNSDWTMDRFMLEPVGFNVRFLDPNGHIDEGGGNWRYLGDLVVYLGDGGRVRMNDARVAYRRGGWGEFEMFRGRVTGPIVVLDGLLNPLRPLAGKEVTFRLRTVMSSDGLPLDRNVDMLRFSVAEPTTVGALEIGAGSTWVMDHRDGGVWIRGDIDVSGDVADRYVSTGGAFGDDLVVGGALDLVLGGSLLSMTGPTVMDVAPNAFADGDLAVRDLTADAVSLVAHGHAITVQGDAFLDLDGAVRANGDLAFDLAADQAQVLAASGEDYALSDVTGRIADDIALDGTAAPRIVTVDQLDRGYGDTLDIELVQEMPLTIEGDAVLVGTYTKVDEGALAYLGVGDLARRCPLTQYLSLTVGRPQGPRIQGLISCDHGYGDYTDNDANVTFEPRSSDATVSPWHRAEVTSSVTSWGYDRVDSVILWTGEDIEIVDSVLDYEGTSVDLVVEDFGGEQKMGFWDQGIWRRIW